MMAPAAAPAAPPTRSSGRASRAAAPTTFAPPKANRGWGTSRARSRTPTPGGSRRGAGATSKKRRAAAAALAARGGKVRRYRRVKRSPDPGGRVGFELWKWVCEDELTDAEREEFGLPPLPKKVQTAAETAAAGDAAEKEASAAAEGAEQGVQDNEDPYSFTFGYGAGTSAPRAPSSDFAYFAASDYAVQSASRGRHNKKHSLDPQKYLANGKRRLQGVKDKRFQGLPGEDRCVARTTRGKQCQNCGAPNSKTGLCFMHQHQADDSSDDSSSDSD